jgi:hypothetical protein
MDAHLPLTAGGEVRIVNTNGRIDVSASRGRRSRSGPSGLPRAPPTRRRELLPRIVIREDAKPDRVSLETERMSGS